MPRFELTAAKSAEVDTVWNSPNGGQIVAKIGELSPTVADVQTLDIGHGRGGWVNDEVVNAYFELIEQRSRRDRKLPRIHCFYTYVYTTWALAEDLASVRRYTKNVDIYEHDLVVIPVHLPNHWCLCVVDMRSKLLVYYDSMGVQQQWTADVIGELERFIQQHHVEKKGSALNWGEWTTREHVGPVQTNNADCGVFVCAYAEFAGRDADPFFSVQDMAELRRKIAYEIIRSRLRPTDVARLRKFVQVGSWYQTDARLVTDSWVTLVQRFPAARIPDILTLDGVKYVVQEGKQPLAQMRVSSDEMGDCQLLCVLRYFRHGVTVYMLVLDSVTLLQTITAPAWLIVEPSASDTTIYCTLENTAGDIVEEGECEHLGLE